MPSILPDAYSRIEITFPPDATATILRLAEIADHLAVSHPAKAQDVKTAINELIRSSLSWTLS